MYGKVLVAVPENCLAETLVLALKQHGHLPLHVPDGQHAVQTGKNADWDLFILHTCLAGVSAWDLCRELRGVGATGPIIFLANKPNEFDHILSLQLGGDDYLIESCPLPVLMAHVQVRLTRHMMSQQPVVSSLPESLCVGGLDINLRLKAVFRNGERILLTRKEFEILAFLIENQGIPVTRSELFEQVWQEQFHDPTTVSVHIHRLREKLEENPARPQLIVSAGRGMGYRFAGEPPSLHYYRRHQE